MKKNSTDPIMTVLTICVGFVGFYLLYKQIWLLQASFIIGLAGILSTFIREKIDYIWQKLIKILSLIVPNILMSIVFYVFLFPISMLAKFFSKNDPLMLKNKGSSTFVDSQKEYVKAYFEKPW